jgi:RHS repeat-associated protein
VHDVSVEISTTTNMRDISGSLQGAGGVGGLLMAEELDSDGDTIASHYYAADGNGNITLTTSDGGSVKGAFRFSTKYMDHEVETRGGIYYYGYRHYSPELGRWLSRDPIGEEGGVNLYGMVGNDAVNLWDVLGLSEGEEICCQCIADGTTVSSIDVDDSAAAGESDDALDRLLKVGKGKPADSVSSLNYGYTWKVTAPWRAFDKKTHVVKASGSYEHTPNLGKFTVHPTAADAVSGGRIIEQKREIKLCCNADNKPGANNPLWLS